MPVKVSKSMPYDVSYQNFLNSKLTKSYIARIWKGEGYSGPIVHEKILLVSGERPKRSKKHLRWFSNGHDKKDVEGLAVVGDTDYAIGGNTPKVILYSNCPVDVQEEIAAAAKEYCKILKHVEENDDFEIVIEEKLDI